MKDQKERGSLSATSSDSSIKDERVYKGCCSGKQNEIIESGDATTKGRRDIGTHVFSDIMEALLRKDGYITRNLRFLPWSSIRRSDLVNEQAATWLLERTGQKISKNVQSVKVLTVPMFPNRDEYHLEYFKVVLIHVAELKKDLMAELITIAQRVRTKVLSVQQKEVRDLDIVVIADEMEKGANNIFRGMAYSKSNNGGTRSSIVFSAKRGEAWIRQKLLSILGKFISTRARRVEEKGDATCRKKGIVGGIFGDLKDCVEFVAGLGTELLKLAMDVKLPRIGQRKTKTERAYDKLIKGMNNYEDQREEARMFHAQRRQQLAEEEELYGRRLKRKRPVVEV